LPRLSTVHVAALVGLLLAGAATWWSVAVEVRSVDRRLDIAGQTLTEELHGELDEFGRAVTSLARTLFVEPPASSAAFVRRVGSQVTMANVAAFVERLPDGTAEVRFSTDSDWLAQGTEPVDGWEMLGRPTSNSLLQYLPPRSDDDRIYVADTVGLPGSAERGGFVVVGLRLHDAVASTGMTMAGGGPEVAFREMSPSEALTTSESLIHREYFLVGDRRWQFEVTPRAGTPFAVDWRTPVLVAITSLTAAAMATFATHSVSRRRRDQREYEVSTGLNDEKDRFLLALSHQVRTPLTAVVGFLDLLRSHDDLDDAERDEFLNRAADHADEVAAIVHDILVVTRDDLDLLVVTTQPTNPVKEALAVASSIPLGDAVIDIHPDVREAPLASADPVRVRQVIRNLVGNAIRHGGSSIHISAHRLADEVVVTVADDGPGLSDEVATALRRDGPEAVSDPQRSDSLGLGLRVAWLLAHRMQGRIEYRRSGSFTMFDFILRAVETPVPSDFEGIDVRERVFDRVRDRRLPRTSR
jgi:signal transduction histidine kinase